MGCNPRHLIEGLVTGLLLYLICAIRRTKRHRQRKGGMLCGPWHQYGASEKFAWLPEPNSRRWSRLVLGSKVVHWWTGKKRHTVSHSVFCSSKSFKFVNISCEVTYLEAERNNATGYNCITNALHVNWSKSADPNIFSTMEWNLKFRHFGTTGRPAELSANHCSLIGKPEISAVSSPPHYGRQFKRPRSYLDPTRQSVAFFWEH